MRALSLFLVSGALATISAATAASPGLPPLVRAYRESSTPPGRAAIESYASAHARDESGALARFALGIALFENKDYPSAARFLSASRTLLPALGDYTTYYLAASQLAQGDSAAARLALGNLQSFLTFKSPLLAKAVILYAKIGLAAGNADPDVLTKATAALRAQAAVLPQPDGDFALALAYDGLRDGAQAAMYYQRVYFMSPATQMAADSWNAMERLRTSLGSSYPAASPQLLLERGQRWIDAKEYSKARAEFAAIIPVLTGLDQDRARVRLGAAQFAAGDYRGALQYLKALDLPHNEADAERWFYIEECARQMNNDDQMMDSIKNLARHEERSVWRLKALVSAGNRYLLTHQPDKYEPLYRAAWVTFPSDSSTAYCHWKITWDAYMANKHDAHDLLREQVEHYPGDNKTATALYYLGRYSENRNEYAAARAYYDRLIAEFPNFYYAVLGRERLLVPQIVAAAPDSKVAEWLDAIEFQAHADYSSQTPSEATKIRIERARLLATAGLTDLAEADVRFGSKTDGQPHLLAVELASTDAAPHLSLRHMKTLAPDYLSTPLENAPKQFWKMLFPLPYSGALVRSANSQNLDPYMVAALIRQESEFNPGAHSHANAYGLTQIVPATGRMLARQQGIPWSSPSLLYQPETNLRLGTHYIRSLLDQWNGRWEQTLASYNAGASRVKEWLAWSNYREPAEFVESIPFTETREYVQAVIRNAAVYKQIYGPAAAIPADETPEPQTITRAIPPTRVPTHPASLRQGKKTASRTHVKVKAHTVAKTRTSKRKHQT